MEGIELVCFKIIAAVGSARSCYIEAMRAATNGKIEEAYAKIEEGEKEFVVAHQAHGELITEEANGNKTDVCLLLLHAEDQLMSAETMKIVAEEHIELCKKLNLK